MTLDLQPLGLAVETLKQAVLFYDSHHGPEAERLLLRDGLIQRFECVYELCWKYIQRWVGQNVNSESAVPTWSRKELFRLAAERGLLADPTEWFTFTEARNLSAHTYNPANADTALQAARLMPARLTALREAFACSNVPIRIDVADLRARPIAPQQGVREAHIVLWNPRAGDLL
jgi:nucleotidyltransferase substrate binding protein (TIGR01987 family)